MRFVYICFCSLIILSQELCAKQLPLIPDEPSPIVYMIRHAEKPPKGLDGKDPPGLSTEGITRAEGLVQTFGRGSKYNIDFIIVEHPKKNGERNRPFNTVEPLAKSLGLKIHSSIRRNDSLAVAAAVKKYKGKGNILICWEHLQMTDIALAIGVTRYAEESGWTGVIFYPHKRFDLIWVIPAPYTQIISVEGERVPILDDGKTPTQDNSARVSRGYSPSLFILMTLNIVYILGLELSEAFEEQETIDIP